MALDKDKLMASAQKLIQQNKLDKAIKELRRILDEDPKDIRVLQKLGDVYTKLGDKDGAAKSYGAVAQFYTEQGFFLKAVAIYKTILRVDPNVIDVNVKLAELYQQLGLMNDCVAQYQLVANMLDRAGKTKESLGILKKMVDLDTENVASRIKLAELYSGQQMAAEAIKEFEIAADQLKKADRADDYMRVAERLLYHDPNRPELARDLAALYLARNDAKRALGKLQVSFKANPRDVETLKLLSQAFKGMDQLAKSVSVLRELAKVHAEEGRSAESESTWRQVIQLKPDDEEGQRALGMLPAVEQDFVRHEPSFVGALPQGPAAAPPPISVTSMNMQAPAGWAPPAHSMPGLPAVMPTMTVPMANPRAPVVPTQMTVPLADPSPPPPKKAATGLGALQGKTGSSANDQVTKLLAETDVYIKYGLRDKALAHVKKVFDLDPDHLDAHQKLKGLLIKAGDVAGAADEVVACFRVSMKRGDKTKARMYLADLASIQSTHPAIATMREELDGVAVTQPLAINVLRRAPGSVSAPPAAVPDVPVVSGGGDEDVAVVVDGDQSEEALEVHSGLMDVSGGEMDAALDIPASGPDDPSHDLASEASMLLPDQDSSDQPTMQAGDEGLLDPSLDSGFEAGSPAADLLDASAEIPADPSLEAGAADLPQDSGFDSAGMDPALEAAASADDGLVGMSDEMVLPPPDDAGLVPGPSDEAVPAGDDLLPPGAPATDLLDSDSSSASDLDTAGMASAEVSAGFEGGATMALDGDALAAGLEAAGVAGFDESASVDSTLDAQPADGLLDPPYDPSLDAAPADGALDAPYDASLDAAPAEGALDAPYDGSLDAQPADGLLDAPYDASLDAPPADGGQDAPYDGSLDAVPADAGLLDAPYDASLDAQPADTGSLDAPYDGSLDAPPADASLDAPPADSAASEFDAPAAEPTAPPAAAEAPPAELPHDVAEDFFPDELAEADFFIQQGLYDEAREIARRILDDVEDSRRAKRIIVVADALERGEEPPPEAAPTAPPPPAAESDSAFDLARELEGDLGDFGEPPGGMSSEPTEQVSVETVLAEFKKGVDKVVAQDDAETHHDLGIAYKEMGLLDDAIGEFQRSSRSPRKEADAFYMIGVCRMEKGQAREATEAFEKALGAAQLSNHQKAACSYELGAAHESLGDSAAALEAFQRCAAVDANHKDVGQRIAALEAGGRKGGKGGADGGKKSKNIGYI